jgi:outer membrane protein assembly factor BamA
VRIPYKAFVISLVVLSAVANNKNLPKVNNEPISFKVDFSGSTVTNSFVMPSVRLFLKSDFKTQRVMVTSRMVLDQFEMSSWFGLKNTITLSDIEQFLRCCALSNRFAQARFTIDMDTKLLTIMLVPQWLIKKIKVTGLLWSKQRYIALYSLGIGQLFNRSVHDACLYTMKQMLLDEGYAQATITDTIVYDYDQATISVLLAIKPSERFMVDRSQVVIQGIDDLECLHKLQERIQKVTAKLIGHHYHKKETGALFQTIRRILFHKGYLDYQCVYTPIISADKKTVSVAWQITIDQQRRFVVIGAHRFNQLSLFQKLKKEFGNTLSLISLQALQERIEDWYHDAGLLLATCQARQKKDVVTLVVNEGSVLHVSAIEVQGATYWSADEIKRRFFAKSFTGVYKRKTFDKLSAVLRKAYEQEGFKQIKIQHQVSGGVDGAHVVIIINEGQNWHGQFMCIDGLSPSLHQALCKDGLSWINFQKKNNDQSVGVSDLQRYERQLRSWCIDQHMFYARVKPVQQEQGIMWQFSGLMEPVTIGSTVVQGVANIPFSTIRHAGVLKRGDVLEIKKLSVVRKRLLDTGIFDNVSVYPACFEKPDTTKDIIINATLDSSAELRARAGLSWLSHNFGFWDKLGYRVGADFLWKNPACVADLASVHLDIGHYLKYGSCSYKVPVVFSTWLPLETKLYAGYVDQPVYHGAQDILYRVYQHGISWAGNYEKAAYKTSVVTGFEWMKVNHVRENIARDVICFDPTLLYKYVFYWYVEPTLFIDHLDNALNPTQGSSTLLSFKGMVATDRKNASMGRFLVEQSVFTPLFGPVILALRGRLGAIIYQDFERIMPTERFYLGGAYSLRGYDPDCAPPLNIFKDSCGQLQYAPVGGKTMLNGTAELRFPLWKFFHGAFFTDLGVLSDKFVTKVASGNLLGASGWGIRAHTPLGIIRFDVGWKWKRLPQQVGYPVESSYAWFLTFGHIF